MVKRITILALALMFWLSGVGLAEDCTDDTAAVKKVIDEAYVQAVHNQRNPEAFAAGFHENFRMYILAEGNLREFTRAQWLENLSRPGQSALPETRAVYRNIDVCGDAAQVKLELHRGDKLIFTDYLNLYRFPDGWKVVAKTFQRH